jgi:hypothetical protein
MQQRKFEKNLPNLMKDKARRGKEVGPPRGELKILFQRIFSSQS